MQKGIHRPTKWRILFEEFLDDPDPAPIRLIPEEGEYSSKHSMYATALHAAKYLKYSVIVQKINGEVYVFRK